MGVRVKFKAVTVDGLIYWTTYSIGQTGFIGIGGTGILNGTHGAKTHSASTTWITVGT